MCNGCVDTESDDLNCGYCSRQCNGVGETCISGICQCGEGYALCGGSCVESMDGSCGY